VRYQLKLERVGACLWQSVPSPRDLATLLVHFPFAQSAAKPLETGPRPELRAVIAGFEQIPTPFGHADGMMARIWR
jgi:hypothetical protein